MKTVTIDEAEGGQREIDTKRYAKIEKIPGGTIEDSRVLMGVMFNKAMQKNSNAIILRNGLVLTESLKF